MIYAFKRCEDHDPVVALQVIFPQTVLFVKATVDFSIGPEYVSLPYSGDDSDVIVDAFKQLNNSQNSHQALIDLVINWHGSFLRRVIMYALSKVDFEELQLTTCLLEPQT
jgi:hypothetical protein